jgi:TfuA protein
MDRRDRAIVFVGPSLAGDPPPAGVELRPPARRGDLLAAAADGARIIGLVDGELYQELAVTPAEVRDVARAGVTLFGAASLGALRAVECPGAMTGIGRVYEAFRDGRLAADDEVAGTYDPVTHRPVAWPLVIVREAFALAARDGVLDAPATAAALAAVRARPFFERTTAAVVAATVAALAPAGPPPAAATTAAAAVAALLVSDEADVKRHDARALLAAVAASLYGRPSS